MSNAYDIAYTQSIQDPDAFWGKVAEDCHWYKKWDKVLDDSRKPFYRWFTGGELNTCYNALDLHVDSGRGDQTALIYDSPVTETVKTFTYRNSATRWPVSPACLAAQGVTKGDRVIIYMPMIPEALDRHAGLRPARRRALGGVRRLRRAGAGRSHQRRQAQGHRVGLLRHRGQEGHPLQAAARRGHRAWPRTSPSTASSSSGRMQRAEMKPGRDLDWDEVLAKAKPADCVPVKATDPLYILYTSGTTGDPQGRRARQRRPRGRPEVDA